MALPHALSSQILEGAFRWENTKLVITRREYNNDTKAHVFFSSKSRACFRPQLTLTTCLGIAMSMGVSAMAPGKVKSGFEREAYCEPSRAPWGSFGTQLRVDMKIESTACGLTPAVHLALGRQADEAVTAGLDVDNTDTRIERQSYGLVDALVGCVEIL
jgi:hypothetical protein